MLYPTPIAKLIDSFTKLPGIGIKTATRLAFYTIGMSDEDVNEFAKNLLAAKRELTYCSVCGNLTDEDRSVLAFVVLAAFLIALSTPVFLIALVEITGTPN